MSSVAITDNLIAKDGAAASETMPLLPTPTLTTPAAQAVRHAVPALHAAIFIVRFRSLVADPVTTMASTLPAVVALQMAYAFCCLPVAGSPAARRKLRRGEKKKTGSEGGGPNVYIAALLSVSLAAFITPLFHVAMILFGAPVTTHIPETFLCAAHISALAIFPLFYVHGVSPPAWRSLAAFRAPLDETFGGLVGATVGAWLGAVPIPLDWDREWQRWPVTILCGVYAGYVLGKAIGGTVAFGVRFGSGEEIEAAALSASKAKVSRTSGDGLVKRL